MPPKPAEPDLDLIIESMIFLYSESRRVTRAVAEQYGLTGSQLLVLKMLEPRGQLSLSELSSRIRAKNSTVTGIIDRMERDGLVVRRRSGEDRRVVHIELTTKGKKLANDAEADPKQLYRALLEELSPRDAGELERIMTKLVSHVRAHLQERGIAEESA
ncbi:MAG TPA: MarR family transcriptional regulator [Polyangiaceae bacterium]|jgi:DNA-binding MarR family transcriptional regulator|nr:MarR family transcriptional regulator [Polyangiaceae bacterium]